MRVGEVVVVGGGVGKWRVESAHHLCRSHLFERGPTKKTHRLSTSWKTTTRVMVMSECIRGGATAIAPDWINSAPR